MRAARGVSIGLVVALTVSRAGFAQSAGGETTRRVALSGHAVVSGMGEFDTTDIGVGGRVDWRPAAGFGVEADLTLYPSELPDRVAFSRRRIEGLFGVTIGPTFDRVRVFGRVRPGFVRLSEAPGPIVCVAIFPPPLNCQLASGVTIAAVDLGGGLEASITMRSFARIDIGDRILRYPGPSIANGRRYDGAFLAHDFRIALGAGVRF